MQAQVLGDDIQAVMLTIKPGETIMAEPGALFLQSENIEMNTNTGGGIWKGIKRSFAGESIFVTHFSNQSHEPGHIGFTAPFIGKVLEIDLNKYNQNIAVQRGCFLCGPADLEICIKFTKKLSAGFFGGEGFILQGIHGSGKTYLHAGGTIMQFDLKPGQKMKIDSGCLVAMTDQVDYSIERIRGFKNLFFGGEGLFMTTLTGPGTVWLQTLPFSKIAASINAEAPSVSGSKRADTAGAAVTIGGVLLNGLLKK